MLIQSLIIPSVYKNLPLFYPGWRRVLFEKKRGEALVRMIETKPKTARVTVSITSYDYTK